jgi:hypothetical protein
VLLLLEGLLGMQLPFSRARSSVWATSQFSGSTACYGLGAMVWMLWSGCYGLAARSTS